MTKKLAILAILCLGPMVWCGCAIFSVLAVDAAGNGTVDAKFKPPKEPTLVLVDSYAVAPGGNVDADRLSQFIAHDLEENKVVPVVDFSALTRLRDRDPKAYLTMSVAAIGRAVGAKQVIYVAVSDYQSQAQMGADMVNWKAAVKVKVVDSQTGASRWPADLADGEPVEVETQYKETDPDKGNAPARDELNVSLADKISKLFHPWEKDQDDPDDYAQ